MSLKPSQGSQATQAVASIVSPPTQSTFTYDNAKHLFVEQTPARIWVNNQLIGVDQLQMYARAQMMRATAAWPSVNAITGTVGNVPFTIASSGSTVNFTINIPTTYTSGVTTNIYTTSITGINHGYSFQWTETKTQKVVKHLAPFMRNHRGSLARSHNNDHQFANANANEILALQLLRKMVDAEGFKRYLRHGFVVAKGPSGLTYQIARNDNVRVVVRDGGEIVAHLCVHVRDVPPTDTVVAKMLIVECDEPDIWKRANVSWNGVRRHAVAGAKAARAAV